MNILKIGLLQITPCSSIKVLSNTLADIAISLFSYFKPSQIDNVFKLIFNTPLSYLKDFYEFYFVRFLLLRRPTPTPLPF